MENKGIYKAILYSRVSTVSDEQAESIDNQILLARNYLDKHPNIELAEPLDKYCERISGKTDIRPKFQEMCERLSRGDIRFLMIKDLKRLSRSVETTYAFFNLMKQYGFEIIQLSSGNIIDSKAFEEVESNLLLGVEALFAQNMVLTQSRYGKTVQRVRCENKILSRKDSTLFGYGWDSDKKDIVIDQEKAEIIRELYNRYVFRNEGVRELRVYLSSMGYHYSSVTVSKWLQESKYVGDWTINRKGSVLGIGQGAKTRRYFRERSEWVHIERPDLAIIDKDIFDLAQEIRLSRVKTYVGEKGQEMVVGNYNGKHLFAGKVYCGECGSSYRFKWSDRNQTIPVYQDSFRQTQRDATFECPNVLFRRVSEEELLDIVVSAITALNIKGKLSIARMIDAITLAIQNTDSETHKREAELSKLKKLESEADKISRAFIEAVPAMRSRLNDQLEDIENKIRLCQEKIAKIDNHSTDEELLRKRLIGIQEQLSGWFDVTKQSLDRKMIGKLVSRITVYKDGRIELSLSLGGLLNYQIANSKGYRQGVRQTQEIVLPSEQTVSDNIMKVFREIQNQEPEQAVINVMGFKRVACDKKETPVMVSLDIRK